MYELYLNKLQEEAYLRNLTASSTKLYIETVRRFLKSVDKKPADLTLMDVREYLLHKKHQNLAASTLNNYNSGLRFFYKRVLHIQWDEDIIPRMKLDYKLPEVMTKEEVDCLLDATPNLKYKCIFSTMYSSGLRVSEVLHLRYQDISRSKMQIYIEKTKSRSDRITILSKRNLDLLTEYWYSCGKPMGLLFPNQFTGKVIDKNSVNQYMRPCLKRAGLRNSIHPHTLRHSFACHLLEAGVEFHYIQELLGHRDPASTEVYLHLTNKALMGINSPFDQKDGEVYG